MIVDINGIAELDPALDGRGRLLLGPYPLQEALHVAAQPLLSDGEDLQLETSLPGHGALAPGAKLSKRMNWSWNASWTVSVGPFLCFATMSSASPRSLGAFV